MSVVIRGGAVPIPEEFAAEFGLREGTSVEWERTEDGRLALNQAPRRKASSQRLRGMLKPYLEPGESGVESFLRWREEDARLDGSR